ncbi:hypothetical protein AGDE_10374 [Angomonas deanei]|nr:hypothetical protein AGDE_10374 [Angomonas deanei]|eukprot:EPY28453.1 hypothetical protein AGDE_10374 [Angomonas deanei]
MERLEELFRQNPNLERLLRPSQEELAGLADSVRTLRESLRESPENTEIIFQLGAALISHSRQSFVEEGINLMQTLVCTRWQSGWSSTMGQRKAMQDLYGTDYEGLEEQIDKKKSESSQPSSIKGTIVKPTAPPASDDEVSPLTSDEEREVEEMIYKEAIGGGPVPPHLWKGNAQTSRIAPDHMDDLALYHYYLALGWIKLKELPKASSCVSQMLLLAPYNKQGNDLKTYIEVASRRERAVNATTALAGASVLLAGVGTVMGLFLRNRSS